MALSIGKINNAPAEIDINQKKSILVDEDNLLTNASAGSGKTTALPGKVRYILEQKLAKPNEILVLSFAKKIREEIQKKLNDIEDMKRQIHTFHSYGWKLLKIKSYSSYQSDFQNYLNLSIKKKYDFIILDAPCSAIGTIRRNPEIFYRNHLNCSGCYCAGKFCKCPLIKAMLSQLNAEFKPAIRTVSYILKTP